MRPDAGKGSVDRGGWPGSPPTHTLPTSGVTGPHESTPPPTLPLPGIYPSLSLRDNLRTELL